MLQKSAGGIKQNRAVTGGKNKSINFCLLFSKAKRNFQPSLGNKLKIASVFMKHFVSFCPFLALCDIYEFLYSYKHVS